MNHHPASLRYWLPAVRQLRIPHPKTRIVPIGAWWWKMLDGEALPEKAVANLKRIASEQQYPVFLRTDFMSGKHEWEKTCYLTRPDDLLQHMYGLFENHGMAMGAPGPTALVFREFLKLDYLFTAFAGMPVACEWRIFATDGHVECKHFYWPPEALERSWTPLPDNWRELRQELVALPFAAACLDWAEGVSRRLGGSWSVDVARTQDGEWFLIDMAPAAESWHPDDHPAPTQRGGLGDD